MSLSIPYESLQEAEMRLSGSMVMYDGEPVYITGVTGAAPGDPKPDIFRVYAVPLPLPHGVLGGRAAGNDEAFRRFISSRRFDFQTPRMGFVNYNNGIYYCCRMPQRQQKQGLCNGTFFCREVVGQRGEGYNLNSFLGTQEFVDTIKGRYPTFPEAIEKLKTTDALAVAFSREYAISMDDDLDGLIFLYHKENKVGFLMDDKITLSSKMMCLKEALVELGLRL